MGNRPQAILCYGIIVEDHAYNQALAYVGVKPREPGMDGLMLVQGGDFDNVAIAVGRTVASAYDSEVTTQSVFSVTKEEDEAVKRACRELEIDDEPRWLLFTGYW